MASTRKKELGDVPNNTRIWIFSLIWNLFFSPPQ